MVSWFIGVPSRTMQPRVSIAGISVLETLWIAAHSQILHECMTDVNESSVDHLRRVGMFKVCLGNVRGSRSGEAENETFLE